MYLHQQLVDNLVLLNSSKIKQLQSKFTFSIIKNRGRRISSYYSFKEIENIITKLAYQYQFSRMNHLVYSMAITRWDYILGATLYNKQFMDTATSNYNIEIFIICMKNGIIPNIYTLETAIKYGVIEIIKILLKEIILFQVTMDIALDYAIKYNRPEIVKLFLKNGMTLSEKNNKSIIRNNNKAMKKFKK